MVVSFEQTSSLANGEFRQDFLFLCAVLLMRSQSVCLDKTQKTRIYSVPSLLPSVSLFLSFSLFSSCSVSHCCEPESC